MRERSCSTVSEPDGGSQNGSGRCGGVLSSRRNRLRCKNPPPTRQAPPPAAARPSPAPGPNRRNHAFSAAAGSEWRRGRSWRNAFIHSSTLRQTHTSTRSSLYNVTKWIKPRGLITSPPCDLHSLHTASRKCAWTSPLQTPPH